VVAAAVAAQDEMLQIEDDVIELQNVYPLPPDPTEFFRRTGYIQNESCDFPEEQSFQTFVPENEN